MKRRFAVVAVMLLVASAGVWADTLVLTNGRRIQGELVGVFGREIEFEERGFARRIIRVPRREIARIEFADEDFRDDRRDNRDGRDSRDDLTGGIPRGMRERQVNVTSRDPWTRHRDRPSAGADDLHPGQRRGPLGPEPPRRGGRRA